MVGAVVLQIVVELSAVVVVVMVVQHALYIRAVQHGLVSDTVSLEVQVPEAVRTVDRVSLGVVRHSAELLLHRSRQTPENPVYDEGLEKIVWGGGRQ